MSAILLAGAFRSRLSKALAVASRRWAQHVSNEEKDRLAPVIQSLSKRYLGRDYGKAGAAPGEGGGEVITLKDLNAASVGLALFTHVILQSNHQLMTGSIMSPR